MKKIGILMTVFALSIVGCGGSGSKYEYDGRILTDTNTGKRYLLKYCCGDTYFVSEEVIVINGNDTTKAFR